MNPRALMAAAMRRDPADRIPTMPQIWFDQALRVYAEADGEQDWIETLARCIENPALIYDYVIRIVQDAGCDGLRLFVLPDPQRVERVGDDLIVLDPETGKPKGRIDVMGGAAFVTDHPPPPVESLAEARAVLDTLSGELPPDGEKVDALRRARERVPDLFVASAPGGITVNTYMNLRGSEQAMADFIERPAFVEAVFDMQVETMIRRSEALLTAGIDALYIGDAAASASVISPKHFARFCLPAYRKFCGHFKNSRILIYIHVCGNSNPILEMLADTGAHAVEPLDPLGGVSVADAKRRIGDQAALMGGVSTLALAYGTPDEVKQEAIRKCREGGPNGYILAAGDMVPPVTPLANLRALVDVARHSLWREGS
jgi:uroporphyrinogen-III decarboxylase